LEQKRVDSLASTREETLKRLTFLVVAVALGSSGCQRQAAPEKGSEAMDTAAAEAPVPAEAPPAAPPEAAPAAPAAPAARGTASRPPAPAPAAPASGPAVAPAPEPEEEPTPALTSRPEPEPRVLAAGTVLPLILEGTVASNTSQVGDKVLAELAEDVSEGGHVLLPAGTSVIGRVTVAQQSGRVKGRARLVVEFDEVIDGGSHYRIDALPVDITAESSKGKDAKIAGGAAAAGAIIGAIAGGGKGALKGGAIGGAAGGAAVLATRGNEVVLESGTRLDVTLTSKAQID
jgi:type IV secretory pathway VirB10-like protein